MKKHFDFGRAMDKAYTFIWKHKFGIALGATLIGAYCSGRSAQKNIYAEQQKAIEKERERQKRIEEYEQQMKEYRENPENHVCGDGLIVDDWWDEGGLDEGVCANIIIGDISLDKMGELGQALKERAGKGGCGSMEPDVLNLLLNGETECSIVLSVVEKEQNEAPETAEEESVKETAEEATDEVAAA